MLSQQSLMGSCWAPAPFPVDSQPDLEQDSDWGSLLANQVHRLKLGKSLEAVLWYWFVEDDHLGVS